MDIAQLEGFGQLKNPMTSSGIEPVTYLLVAWPQPTTLLCAPSGRGVILEYIPAFVWRAARRR
jgi:hypothetical protein